MFSVRWKKQIFTEAEMVAQAMDVDAGEVAKILPTEDDVTKEIEGKDNEGTEAATKEQEPERERAVDTDGQPQKTEDSTGFNVDENNSAPAEPEPASTCAEGVKALPEEDVQASKNGEPALDGEPVEASVQDSSPSGNPSVANGEASAVVRETSPVSPPVVNADRQAHADETPALPAETNETAADEETHDATPTSESPVKPVAVPFPSMPRVITSQSTQSNLSELDSGASTSDIAELAPTDGKDKSKARKRLSSIRGLVRRISDQGASRSQGGRPSSGGKSPMGELDEATAMRSNAVSGSGTPGGDSGDKKKKRLSLQKKT